MVSRGRGSRGVSGYHGVIHSLHTSTSTIKCVLGGYIIMRGGDTTIFIDLDF